MITDPNRVKEIFLGAFEQPNETARASYLDRACGSNVALRKRIEALLRSHDTEDSFLATPAVKPPDTSASATQELGIGATEDDATQTEIALTFLQTSTRPDSLGRLGHYEVLQVLDRGGFGIVLRAFDDHLQRVVAVKTLAPQLAATSPARKRFLREARSSAKVRHENVVQVYAVEEQPLPYLVMEFIPGETLQQRLDRTGPLDVLEVVQIGRQIAEGLAAAHSTGLIHRDIKPANILLEPGTHERVKITDFGLARAADDASLTQSGFLAGTPMFMAPEQARGETLDHRADLFSFGSVLYQMVSGRPPFRAPTTLAVLKRVAEESARPIPEIIPETPAWLCDIIAKLHAKNPADRFQSAREVADLLADCAAKLKAKQEVKNVLLAPAVAPAAPPKSHGRKGVVAVAVLLLSVLALAVTEFTGVTHLFHAPVDIKVVDAGGKKQDPKVIPQAIDADRRAAEYVLSIGGKIRIDDEDGDRGDAALPREAFRLTSVNLTRNKHVTNTDLAVFKGCTNLTHIDLAGNMQVSDEGLAHIACCKNLTMLVLWQTQISDAGLGYFKDCKKLTKLWLDSTPISDAGLKNLVGLTKLEEVYLDKMANVTAAGRDELAKALPQCRIHFTSIPTIHDRWFKAIAILPLDQQSEAVGDKLKEKLPGFDGAFFKALTTMKTDRQTIMVDAWLKERQPAFASMEEAWFKVTPKLSADTQLTLADAWLKERKPAFAGMEDAWLKAIPRMSADAQAVLVAAWLKERNPAFVGEVTHKIDGGAITSVEVPSRLVQDLTPLKALTGLRSLTCRSTVSFDNHATRDAAVLRSLKKLENINARPVAEFWKEFDAKQAEFKDWLKLVPALAAKQQVDAVAAKLKEHNPGFDGDLRPKIEDGVVTEILIGCYVADLSPVRALVGLKSFTCYQLDVVAGRMLSDVTPLKDLKQLKTLTLAFTPLKDLTQLKDLKPTSLAIINLQVSDLAPIKDMPLTSLNFYMAHVTDLSALSDMKLTSLSFGRTGVTDLSPLKHMKLTHLDCHESGVTNLAALKGMPLTSLNIRGTQVTDLTPLQGMPLTELDCGKTKATDLTPLQAMPLTKLICHDTQVSDLSPLKGMPLEEIRLTPKNITKGIEILRDMTSLKTIGIGDGETQVWPAEQFWSRHKKGEFK